MTHDEMAAELRAAGWRVKEPLTQENCRHPNMRGSGSLGADGSGHSNSHCPDCGYENERKWGPRADYNPLSAIPHN